MDLMLGLFSVYEIGVKLGLIPKEVCAKP